MLIAKCTYQINPHIHLPVGIPIHINATPVNIMAAFNDVRWKEYRSKFGLIYITYNNAYMYNKNLDLSSTYENNACTITMA